MTYRIAGLDPTRFAHLIRQSDDELARHGALRVTATGSGYPCRITLEDAPVGESLILVNHVSHDVPTPYRSAYAIYVREEATEAADYVDMVPPVMRNRPLGLRGFDEQGMLRDARLALPGEADEKIRDLLTNPAVAEIHAHNAAHGCFAARIVRD